MARATKPAAEPAATTAKELKDTLWKAADRLRGSLDASQYKDVVLGLVFLRYASEAFAQRREQIHTELSAEGWDEEAIGRLIDDHDEYLGQGVFWVPVTARWDYLAQYAKGLPAMNGQPGKPIGQLVDEAIELLMGSNPSLRGTMVAQYNRDNIDQRRLGEIVDLFNDLRFTGEGSTRARDLLGEVYEYFLGKFSAAEGKRGGEYFTPPSVVRTMVEILEPKEGRIYDPACGSGGMFVQAEKFLEAHDRDKTALAIYGQESNERTWRLAKMNLAVHGFTGNLGPRWQDTFARDVHDEVQMDYALCNPPFNSKVWVRNESDPRWRYGVPPAGNANYAWMQHILSKLATGGRAGVVMANGSMASNSGGEGQIRAQFVEADLVACMLALPPNLFRGVAIPACVWFFAKDKDAGEQGSIDRRGQVLFIDARAMGHMVTRAERDFSEEDIARIADTYRAWRGTSSAPEEYADEPGFSRSVTLAEIKDADYALTPGRYVGSVAAEDDREPIEQKIERLGADLLASFDESARLADKVSRVLGRINA